MRTIAAALLLASLLFAGCSKVQPLTEVSASLTTLPLPSGAAVVPSASGAAVESCDATASLRPFAAGGPNVDEIRRRCRLIVGVDQSTNLFSFHDPISGELPEIVRQQHPRMGDFAGCYPWHWTAAPHRGASKRSCTTGMRDPSPCLEFRHIARRC
jgi:hypothetical protein